jgi:hypothetical protein
MSGLFLGPVAFEDFEVPGRIVFGGRQRVAIHQLPGGGRVIDALGRDDAPLGWAGTFSGASATARALQLDLMRAGGLPWLLAWDVLSYMVVVTEFSASYERTNWIPYRIVCSVVVDETTVLAQALLSLAENVLGDLAAASGIAGIDLSAATAALAEPSAIVPGSGSYVVASSALSAASGSVGAGLLSSGATLLTNTDFPSLAGAARQSAQFAAAQGYVQRAQTNLANAGS